MAAIFLGGPVEGAGPNEGGVNRMNQTIEGNCSRSRSICLMLVAINQWEVEEAAADVEEV